MCDTVVGKIRALLEERAFVIIAIDGRCGAGKTTVAAELQKRLDCNVVHMDDFFLRQEQKTEQRLATAGENIDHERFLREVLLPLSRNKAFSYRPYNCKRQALAEPVRVLPKSVTVIEGSYSCHSALWDYYDLHVFMDIDSDSQMKRIIARNADMAEVFKKKWIPLEEKYFKAFNIKERCELCIKHNGKA